MDTWATQIRKGLIELWILGHLSQGQSYAYQLRELLFENGQIIPRGTVTRVLARLQREGWITVHDGYSPLGPRRQYCQLSPKGADRLRQMRQQWQALARATEKSLAEGGHARSEPAGECRPSATRAESQKSAEEYGSVTPAAE